MKHLVLSLAALITFQAQAAANVKLPINQENHHYWMRCVSAPIPGSTVIAILNHDVPGKGQWKKGIDFPLGSRLLGSAKAGANEKVIVTFNKIVLPDSRQFDLEAISLVDLKEGE